MVIINHTTSLAATFSLKTFLASSLALLCAGLSLESPAQAELPDGNDITNPGTPVTTPVPRSTQKVVGQNNGVQASPTATTVSTTLKSTTVVCPTSDP